MSKVRSRNILLLVVFFAFILRIYAINFGFPFTESRPDETISMYIALGYGIGDLNPHNFHWPSLFSYIIFFFYRIYILLGFLFNYFYSWKDVAEKAIINPNSFLLISRLVSVVFGTWTVYFIYKVGKIFFNKRTGIVASIFLAFTYLHVRDSHFGTPDILMVFLAVVTIYFIGRIYKKPSLHNYIFTGLFFGLAVSSKYNAFFLLAPVVITHVFIVKERKGLYLNNKIALLLLFALMAFSIGTPFWIFDFRTFISDIAFECRHLAEGHEGIILGRGWRYHLMFSLWHGMGWPLLIMSLCGFVYSFFCDIKKSLRVFSFPFIYYIVVGYGYTVFARHMLPVIPFAILSAAVICDKLLNLLDKKNFTNYKYYLIRCAIIVPILFPSASNIVQLNNILSKRDNRVVVAEWIESNIPVDVQIRFIGCKYATILLSKKYQSSYRFNNTEISKNIDSSDLPLYLIVEYSSLYFYSYLPDDLKDFIQDKYDIHKIFTAKHRENCKNLYDQQDAFYVPYADFGGIIRPGPDYMIYKKK